MPPIATASAPSSLLPMRIARQGVRGDSHLFNLGQGWSSQSRRAMRGATICVRASTNITCCANQTQTAQRKSYSGPTSPPSGSVKEKVKPRLDDGGVGFPPFRFGGGGGGGGGGGSNSSDKNERQDLRDVNAVEQEEKDMHRKLQKTEHECNFKLNREELRIVVRVKKAEQQRGSIPVQHVETLKQKVMKLRKENESLKRRLASSEV